MFIKLIRLGRDAELRSTQNGKQVLNFAGAYDVGYGQNKKTQWIDCSLWGDRGVSIQQYMKKGTQVVINGDDLELETYPKNDGTQGSKLKCRVVSLEFAGSRQDNAEPNMNQAPQHQTAPQQAPGQPPAQPQSTGGFDDFDDVPF